MVMSYDIPNLASKQSGQVILELQNVWLQVKIEVMKNSLSLQGAIDVTNDILRLSNFTQVATLDGRKSQCVNSKPGNAQDWQYKQILYKNT